MYEDSLKSKYIQDKSDLIALSVYNKDPRNGINLRGKERIEYQPNAPSSFGMRFQYKWLGFQVDYAPGKTELPNRGHTTATDFSLFAYGKKMGFSVYYLVYKGYYLYNFTEFDTLRKTRPVFPTAPDLSTINSGLNFYYIFNHRKFSYRSTYLHNEMQLRSAGSFILNANLTYFRISNNGLPLYPPEVNADRSEALNSGEFYSFSVLPGYAYNFVIARHFYVLVSPAVGIMGQFQEFKRLDNSLGSRFDYSPRFLLRAGMGYNGEHFFITVNALSDIYNYTLGRGREISYVLSELRLIVGYRFRPPAAMLPVSRAMDKIGHLFKSDGKGKTIGN